MNDRSSGQLLTHMAFINRENLHRHHRYDEEMHQYELLKQGDMAAIDEAVKIFSSDLPGHVSEDKTRNMRYLFVACITLATRFAMEGGMDNETAYNTSDMYILRMDKCTTIDEIKALHKEMFTHFTVAMNRLKKEPVNSKPIVRCLDEIDLHLHQQILLPELAEKLGLNPKYLSTLFHREMGITLSKYIQNRRIEAARNMLKYSDYTCSQIASFLAFSSQSYFIRVFREESGMTPAEYRRRFFRVSFGNSGSDD